MTEPASSPIPTLSSPTQPSVTLTQPSLTPSPNPREAGLNTAVVIGGVVGGVAAAASIAIVLIVILAVVLRRQRRPPKQEHIYDNVGLPELPPRPQVNVSYNVTPIDGIKVDNSAAASANSIQTLPNTSYTSNIQAQPNTTYTTDLETEPYYY